jgi:hypothetical protein
MISDRDKSIGAGGTGTRPNPGTNNFYALTGCLVEAVEKLLAKETITADDPIRSEIAKLLKDPEFAQAKYMRAIQG